MNDQMCDAEIRLGLSGFCDCDGDGVKSPMELGYGCDATPGRCDAICFAAAQASSGDVSPMCSADSGGGPPRHRLRQVLELLHRALGEPLDPADSFLWQRSLQSFTVAVSTVLKYEKHGRRHPRLFGVGGLPDKDMIDPDLLTLLDSVLSEPSRASARRKLLDSGLIREEVEDMVFSFRVFTPAFCSLLMEEIQTFYDSKLPARRPNSMNNYGIILNEIGLEPLIFTLQDAVIQPLAAVLLPLEGSELESHHAFTIRYRGGEDTHLDVHTDDSDVTFNVNIFGNYTGAPLVFCGLHGDPDHRHFRAAYQHELGHAHRRPLRCGTSIANDLGDSFGSCSGSELSEGHAVLHRGRHRHGAEDIESGERMNLVVWSYSYNYRSSTMSEKRHQREKGPPDIRCVSYSHDRDFGQFRTFPPGKEERHRGRGWCPPRGKEYAGFVPDVADSQTLPAGQGR